MTRLARDVTLCVTASRRTVRGFSRPKDFTPSGFLIRSCLLMNVDDAEIVSRWLGRTINNKYVVQSVVGNGGMAVVYAVKHRNGKRFALKMLHRELSLNQFIRQRFVREGYVANRVEHDGAVAVIDDDVTEDGSAFLVMELLQGVTLERLWEANGNRLTLECTLAIVEQLLDVLAAAHAQNIVHRDLKPANVFVTRTGQVKILDFGIARLREGDGAKTETGTTLGTPLFMPPEQASGRSRDVDARTDLWAVGATMFSLLSGHYVHDGENAAQVLIAVATTPAKSLASVMPDMPAEVVAIVDKALAFHNEDRWESAIAMRNALLTAQANLGLSTVREFLGRVVRTTAPGPSNTDIQSTPVTTPQPSTGSGPDRTERLPLHPTPDVVERPRSTFDMVVPSGVPELNTTKRSALSQDSAVKLNGELGDSSARAMTVTPEVRSGSHALIRAVLFAALAAVVGAVVAIRFVMNGATNQAPSTVATPPVSAPVALATVTATPVVAPAPTTEVTPAAPVVSAALAPNTPDAATTAEPRVGNVAIGKGGVRRIIKGGKVVTTAVTAAAAPAAAPPVAEPPHQPAAPPPATPPPATATPGHRPTLDRTSPF